MEEKIEAKVKCPNPDCNCVIQFRKKVALQSANITCPKCKNKIHLEFDIEAVPQTYKASIPGMEPTQAPAPENKKVQEKKTITYKDSDLNKQTSKHFDTSDIDDDAEEQTQHGADKKKTVYSKNYVSKPSSGYKTDKCLDDFDDDFDDDTQYNKKKKKPHHHKLKDKIYITHIRYLGLVKDKYQIFEGNTTIGREDDEMPSDISLKGDSTISRQSIVISIEADEHGFEYKLKVKNATNPVRVNDRKVKVGDEIFLDFGDVIKLGNTKLVFDNK